jgi:hypothetical protein
MRAMKKSSMLCMIATVCWLAIPGLDAQTTDCYSQLAQIQELLKPADSDSTAAKGVKTRMRGYPAAWKKMLDDGQFARFGEYNPSNQGLELDAVPDLEAKVAAFTQSVSEEKDRRDAATIAAAKALIAQVGTTLPSAQKAEDLDALMMSLNKTKISEYENNPKSAALARDLQVALQIVGNWQEYLMAKESGNTKSSMRLLEQISSALASAPILPRSVVLRLINPPAQPASAAQGDSSTKSPVDQIQSQLSESGDSAAALMAVKAISRGQLNDWDDNSLLRALQAIEELRKLEPCMVESEVFANTRTIQSSFQGQGRYSITRAIEQIELNAIARNYGIEPPSAKITSARKALESIALSAKAQQDWTTLRKAINSLDNLTAGTHFSDSQKRVTDLKIMSLLVLGQAAEQRNDFEAAATAYLEASSLDGQYLQRDVGYSKLAAFKEKSPDKMAPVLAKAEENRQRAEASRYTAEREMMRSSMGMNRGMPGMPYERMQSGDLAALRPMVQEVVAEFLKGKRLELEKAAEPEAKPKQEAGKKAQ